MIDAAEIAKRAHEMVAFADGFSQSDPATSARLRLVARDLLDLIDAYEAEASGRRAMQANYERAMGVISSRGYADFVLAQSGSEADHAGSGNPFL